MKLFLIMVIAMADALLRDLSYYARVRDSVNPPVLDGFAVGSAPRGTWPTASGSPGQTSRSGEPLVSDRWSLRWRAALEAAAAPDHVLVGGDLVVVGGVAAYRIWNREGAPVGQLGRGAGTGFFDPAGHRLVASDAEGGLCTFVLPEGTRDAYVMLAQPQAHMDRQLLQGPDGALVLVSAQRSPLGPPPMAVVEVVRVRDWGARSNLQILTGLDPLAGIIREADGDVQVAIGPSGPVIATLDGVLWCDWLLRPLRERRWSLLPQGLSIDDTGYAYLTCARGGDAHFMIIPPGEAPICDVLLPWKSAVNWTPPLVGRNGHVFLTSPDHIWALTSDGRLLWSLARALAGPPGTVTANGLLLVGDDRLYAFTVEGERHVLWQPPAPLVTSPVLARGCIHVASADTLHVLEPQ